MANFYDIINSETPVLIDFYADWCGPCKMLEPTIKELASEVKGKAKVLKVDVDKNPEVAKQLNIMGVPTLILFKKGEIVWRESGIVPKQMLLDAINKNAA